MYLTDHTDQKILRKRSHCGPVLDVRPEDQRLFGMSVSPCVVNTVLNPSVNVSAYEVRTRESSYVTTNIELSKKGCCSLSGLNRSTSIAPGGIVCTSGRGGIYPADLIIGTVEEIKNDTTNISSYAVVKTQVDFSQLRDVFIITQFRGMGVGDAN